MCSFQIRAAEQETERERALKNRETEIAFFQKNKIKREKSEPQREKS